MTTDNGITLTTARRRELCVVECTACEREYFYGTDLDELDETLGQYFVRNRTLPVLFWLQKTPARKHRKVASETPPLEPERPSDVFSSCDSDLDL